MHIEALLPRASAGCIDCPATPPVCSCSADQECVLVQRDCSVCEAFRCIDKGGSSSSKSNGPSAGALAGAVIGSLVLLAGAVFLFLWWRRRQRQIRANTTQEKKDVPASAETVLNRPDLIEKPLASPTERSTVRVYSLSSETTIDLDPESQAGSRRHDSQNGSFGSNPFDDNNSIRTAGTEGTNVIPIALVSPDPSQSSQISSSTSPMRPPRPDANLDNNNINNDMLRTKPQGYAQSTVSGISRNSYMSSASYASDFLNEAPVIMTASHGPVRQFLGVQKAEVINASGSTDQLKVPSRPVVTSPLAATSFGPADVIKEDGNPFSDRHSTATTQGSSPARNSFLSPNAEAHSSMQSNWQSDGPMLPWAKDDTSRPSSVSTQAGSVIGIENATRVNVGLLGRSPSYRTTIARLVTPSTSGTSTFEEQQRQQRALTESQQQLVGDKSRRTSGSSVVSATADSILESFHFVPPSPISNRPLRSPPVSPLAQQSFSGNSLASPRAQQTFAAASQSEPHSDDYDNLPAPPNRRTLGLSTGSQMSTASSGLGAFPFQIDTGSSSRESDAPSSYTSGGRQRASLDTLALTSDLSSYPLAYDRDSTLPPLPNGNIP